MTLLFLLLACEPKVDDAGADTAADADTDTDADTDADTDTDTDTGPVDDGYQLVVATVASDYTSGQLAVVEGTTGAVTDALLPTSSDPVVEVDLGHVFLIDRSSENTVRMYDGSDWSAPLVEFSTGDGTNPQDAALCEDVIVVSMLASDSLGLYDSGTGLSRGTIDLSAWDDGDGSPEADSIVKGEDGDLYVALGRLDTSAYPWTSADGTGTILRVSCDTLEVTEEWTTGPNPGLIPHPTRRDRLLLRTGDYFNPDYTAKLDGALAFFDLATGTIDDPVLTEADFGMNLSTLVGNADGNALLIADDAYSWSVFCVNLETMEVTDTPFVDSYIGDAVASADGQVWVAYREGYAGTGDPVLSGLVRWDPATCTAQDPIASVFPPYTLALLE